VELRIHNRQLLLLPFNLVRNGGQGG
jgi:hypothetical protein